MNQWQIFKIIALRNLYEALTYLWKWTVGLKTSVCWNGGEMCWIPSSLWLNVAPRLLWAENIPEASSVSLPHTLLDLTFDPQLRPHAETPDERRHVSEVGTFYLENTESSSLMETACPRASPRGAVVLWCGFMFRITDHVESFLSWCPLTRGQSGDISCPWAGSWAVMP